MPSYFVRQPNGMLARWSTVVDHFCEVDLTDDDARGWCASQGLTGVLAVLKIRHAHDDIPTGQPCCDQAPLRRWHECLTTILHVHGTAGLAKFLAEHPSTYAKAVT